MLVLYSVFYFSIVLFSQSCRYVIIYNKGYQEFENPYSSVTTKVKGTSLTNLTGKVLPLYGGVHVWDTADYIIPPEVKTISVLYFDSALSPMALS